MEIALAAWTPGGLAVDGERKGHRLVAVPVEEALYWGVMKFWYPDLELVRPRGANPPAVAPAPRPPSAPIVITPTTRRARSNATADAGR